MVGHLDFQCVQFLVLILVVPGETGPGPSRSVGLSGDREVGPRNVTPSAEVAPGAVVVAAKISSRSGILGCRLLCLRVATVQAAAAFGSGSRTSRTLIHTLEQHRGQ